MKSVTMLFLVIVLSCFVNGYSTGNAQCTAEVLAHPPDPKTECCGKNASPTQKILGGIVPQIDKFPWLALIEYDRNGKISTLCGGSLISGKYVLTAAHCVIGPVLDTGKPINIRLGEYDTSHDGPDCMEVETDYEDCTDGAIIIPIQKIVPHPEYIPKHFSRINDIALIEMKESSPFTDFIRPICLPTEDITLSSSPVNFIVAGWGNSSERSSVRQQVDLPFVTQEKCQPAYSSSRRNVTLWKGQICAGGQKDKDTCSGDGGLPLMYENAKTFEVVGIVSFGVKPCGQENIPGVYTNVYEYVPWIKSVATESG